MSLAPGARVALVHDWLTGMRGGERVLERIARFFPEAPIFTLVWKRGGVSAELESHPVRTSFLQHLPDAERRYRWYLPLFPRAIESFDLSAYDVVVSTSHAVAKAAPVRRDAFHLSYVHTPMRYIWELESQYFPPGRFPGPLQWMVRRTCARLRRWDVATSQRHNTLLANSAYIADRIRRHWDRDAEVVYPPVDVARFTPGTGRRDYYLLAGAFAPYKRGELAIEACRSLGRKLVVAGSGQQTAELRAMAGAEVEFREGWQDEAALQALYAGARALLFPGVEDFGIMPVEAMAAGCPVIAYGVGGALETVGAGLGDAGHARLAAGEVVRAPGGVLVPEQSAASLAAGMQALEAAPFDPHALRAHAEPFAPERFDREFADAFGRGWSDWRERIGAGS